MLVFLVGAAYAEIEIVDRQLGVTLRLPEGFEDFPAGRGRNGVVVSYARAAGTDRQIVVLISSLRGALPRELPLPQSYPGGELSTFEVRWKSEFELPVVQIRQQVGEISMTVMTIQIPISPRALKIEVAGDSANEEEMREILTAVIASLDGKTNWLTSRERKDRIVQAVMPVVGFIIAVVVVVVMHVRSRRRGRNGDGEGMGIRPILEKQQLDFSPFHFPHGGRNGNTSNIGEVIGLFLLFAFQKRHSATRVELWERRGYVGLAMGPGQQPAD